MLAALKNYLRTDTMQELRNRLDEKSIEWVDESDGMFVRTKVPIPGYEHRLSIINQNSGEGLFEAWHPKDPEPTYSLTIDEVIAMIEGED